MKDKIELAKGLVHQKKYAKALNLLKKVNSKKQFVTAESLDLEATCLFFEKKYPLAQIKLQAALKIENDGAKKATLYSNLASIAEKQGNVNEAMGFLKAALNIDGSLNAAERRFSLVQMASSIDDFTVVEEYAPLLKNVSQFATPVKLLLADVQIKKNNKEAALGYLNELATDIKTGVRGEVDVQSIISTLNGYHLLNQKKKEKELLGLLFQKYENESWYKELVARVSSDDKNGSTETTHDNAEQDLSSLSIDAPSNDTEALKSINRLKSELESMGAEFHKDLCIVDNEGEISVRCGKKVDHIESLMNVPLQCMPFVEDYRYDIEDGKMVASPKKRQVNPQARSVMSRLVEMYNACNKLDSWKDSYPLFCLAGHQPLFEKFIQARSNGASYLKFYAPNKDEIPADILVQSFISSRVMTFAKTSMRRAGVKLDKELQQAFIPVIDLMNHKMGGKGYEQIGKKTSLQTFVEPGPANQEVFVQYNLDDPLMTLLIYGFVDASAKWIYSVPMMVSAKSGLKIRIDNFVNAADLDSVPDALMLYRDYFPANISRNGEQVSISKLVLPGKEHQSSLREILAHVLKTVGVSGVYDNPRNLEAEIEHLENQLIRYNLQYWTELKEEVDLCIKKDKSFSEVVADSLISLCEISLNHIQAYEGAAGTLLRKSG